MIQGGAPGTVRAKAPLRISFAGGGTDVMPYPVDHGGCVLSVTIDMYAFAHLLPRDDDEVTVVTDDPHHLPEVPEDRMFDGHTDLVGACLRRMAPSKGLDLVLASDAPPGTGLGSSSALVVAMLTALGEFEGRTPTPYELAAEAYTVERYDLGQAGGMQDQYAAVFGGFNFIEFHDEHRVVVHPLRIRSDLRNELHASLVLCNTGRRRKSGGILSRQVAGYVGGEAPTVAALAGIKELALEMKEALLVGDLHRFAKGLDEGWRAKRELAEGITTPELDDLYDVAVANGALGGKVLGAGGGGYLLLMCDPTRRAELGSAMTAAGAPVTRFSFTDDGAQVWRAR